MEIEKDIMSLDEYTSQEMLVTLMTKSLAHVVNPFFMVEDLNSAGQYIKTDNNKCRIMIGNEFDNLIFRGQCKDWDFTSSYSRIKSSLDKCVQWIKKEDFKEFFRKTPFFIRLPHEIGILDKEFEFDLEALAQHYEFKTNYLDITKDFNVAMFFAYTDYVNGQYVPVDFRSKDKNYEPYIYVASLGMLHMAQRDKLKIVGFQASPRPITQSAMALDLGNFEDLKSLFTKIPLPKEEYFVAGVFSSFKKGFKILKPDILTPYVERIKDNKNIVPSLLEQYCKEFKVNFEETEKELNKNGYTINDTSITLEPNEIDNMNQCIDNEIIPYIKTNIKYRGVARSI